MSGSSQSILPRDAVEVVALLLAGFVSYAEASRRLGLEVEHLQLLLGELGFSDAAMLPVDIDAEFNISYANLGRRAFDTPLFDDVVDHDRGLGLTKRAMRLRVPTDTLIDAAVTLQPAAPKGLIFHVGRCGSTLLCNLIASVGDCVVLREPEIINGALMRLAAERDPVTKERLGALVGLLLRSLGHGVRLDPYGRSRPCVIKLSSWNTILADQFVHRLEATPLVVVTRHPLETVASMLNNPPYWYTISPELPDLTTLLDRLEAALFFSESYVKVIKGALHLPPERTLFVTYSDLVENPLHMLVRVCRHVNIDPERVDTESVGAVMKSYSKGSGTSEERFEPQGRHHRNALEAELRDLVNTISAESWQALVERTSSVRP